MGWYDRLIFNTRERLTSSDLNLMQRRIGWWVAEQMNALHNKSTFNHITQPGKETILTSSSGTQAHGDVFSGLLVVPHASYLEVQGGIAGIVQPGLSDDAHDNTYVIAGHDGVTNATILYTTNSQGVGVWRIVEMQAVDSLMSNASVDIWNALTKLFTSSIQSKLRRAILQFRIREGVVGSFPVLDSAWVPIAAIYVPPGVSGYDYCDVWDVRPLVSARSSARFSRVFSQVTDWNDGAGAAAWPRTLRANYYSDSINQKIVGHALVEAQNYLAGGRLINSVPAEGADFGGTGDTGGDASYFAPYQIKNRALGYTPTLGVHCAVYAVFPAGLPRWARWTETHGDSGRYLAGPCGILITDAMVDVGSGPESLNFTGWKLISMPTTCRMSGTHPGVQIAYLSMHRITAGAVASSSCAGGRFVEGTSGGPQLATTAGPTAAEAELVLHRGVSFPNRATEVSIRVVGRTQITAIGGGVSVPTGTTTPYVEIRTSYNDSGDIFDNDSYSSYTEVKPAPDLAWSDGGVDTSRVDVTFHIPVFADPLSATDRLLTIGLRIYYINLLGLVVWRSLPTCYVVGWRTE